MLIYAGTPDHRCPECLAGRLHSKVYHCKALQLDEAAVQRTVEMLEAWLRELGTKVKQR